MSLLTDAWVEAGLGVGAKIHMIHSHLLDMARLCPAGEGLGVWGEQAMEASHGAYKAVQQRFHGKDRVKRALMEFNYLRM